MGFWEGLKIGFLSPRVDPSVLERTRRGRTVDPAAGLDRRSDPNVWLTALWTYVVELDRTLAWVHWDLPEGSESTEAAVQAMLDATEDVRAFTAFHADEVPPKLASLFSRADVLAARWTRIGEDWQWGHDMQQLTRELDALGARWAAISDELRGRWVMPRAGVAGIIMPASQAPTGLTPG